MSNLPHIVVVGGGIAGLATAHRLVELSQERRRRVTVSLLEANSRPGGSIATERTQGFVIEAGPDSFISEKPWALELCERVGLTRRLVQTRDEHRRTYVVHAGRLHPLPEGFLLLAPTRFWPLLNSRLFTWPGKLRMGLDLLLPRGRQRADESLTSFVTRRLGREALERVAQPLIGGIYTADPDVLSLAATMPRFLEMERRHRSVILAMWRQQRVQSSGARRASGARWSLFLSLDDGMQTLVDALSQRLPEGVLRCRAPVVAMAASGSSWRLALPSGPALAADGVVLATPANRSADLLRHTDAQLGRELDGIPYASSATVNLAYPASAFRQPLDGFGFVVPRLEARDIVACTYSSIKYPGRAPDGFVLLRAFVGGALQEERYHDDDDTTVARVRRELRHLLGLQASPVLSRVHRHPGAMPQYEVGHLERMVRIDARLARQHALALAGNAYRGVGIPDCIHTGELAAETVFEAVAGG